MYALVMIVSFIIGNSGAASPPQVIGEFNTLVQCEDAVKAAKGFNIDSTNQPRISYVCIKSK